MKQTSSRDKIVDKFDVIILGDYGENEKLFAKTFPFKHKFINRFDLFLKDKIKFPNDFMNFDYPEIMDKLLNSDILILTYYASNKLSIEYLKRFYYLYYCKFEEKNRPKKIILIDFDCNSTNKNNEKTEFNGLDDIQKLFNGYYFYSKDSEEKLLEIFQQCVVDLKAIYDFKENYCFYDDIKIEKNKDINIFMLIYGNKELENIFLKILLESKCNFECRQMMDNYYELKYSNKINKKEYNFMIRVNMLGKENSYFNSISNILLYDINNEDSFNETRNIVKEYITTNGPSYQQIINIFALNTNPSIITETENNDKIKKGKNLAYEIGADFSVLNTNSKTLGDEIKIKLDNLLEKILENVNHTKNKKYLNEIQKKQTSENIYSSEIILLKNIDSPLVYMDEINNKINNQFKNNNDFLFNICPTCYKYINIYINDTSNIITLYCSKCNNDPAGLNYELFNKFKKSNSKLYHCMNCQNILNFNFEENKLFCECQLDSKKHRKSKGGKRISIKNNPIPCFLIDSYCNIHKKFHKYYAKYSKKGLCEDCKEERKNKYFVNSFNENKINDLIKQKKAELNKELEFITSLQNKFNECINSLLCKFEQLIENKIKMHVIKSDIINNLEVVRNNYTIFSNVSSLKFDLGEKFTYNEFDSTEKKINDIYNYLNSDLDVNNLYFGKENNIKKEFHMGPFNNLIFYCQNIYFLNI